MSALTAEHMNRAIASCEAASNHGMAIFHEDDLLRSFPCAVLLRSRRTGNIKFDVDNTLIVGTDTYGGARLGRVLFSSSERIGLFHWFADERPTIPFWLQTMVRI